MYSDKYTLCYFDIEDTCIGYKQCDTVIQMMCPHTQSEIIDLGEYMFPDGISPLGMTATELLCYGMKKKPVY
jgi:hypothetical protein